MRIPVCKVKWWGYDGIEAVKWESHEHIAHGAKCMHKWCFFFAERCAHIVVISLVIYTSLAVSYIPGKHSCKQACRWTTFTCDMRRHDAEDFLQFVRFVGTLSWASTKIVAKYTCDTIFVPWSTQILAQRFVNLSVKYIPVVHRKRDERPFNASVLSQRARCL